MSSDLSETVRKIVVSEEKCSIFSLKLLDQCVQSLKTAKDISITFNGEVVTLNADQQVFSFKALKENQATDCFREVEAGRNECLWEEIGQVQSKLQPQRQLGLVRETVRQKRTEEENWRNQHKSKEFNQSSVSKSPSIVKKGARPLTKTPRSIPTKPTVPNRLLPPRPTPKSVKPLTPTPATPPPSNTNTPSQPLHPIVSSHTIPSPVPSPAPSPIVPTPVITPKPAPVVPPSIPPPPTILTSTTSISTSTSTTPPLVNTTSKPSQPTTSPPQITPSSEEDLRKRIIHLLASEELQTENIISRFVSDRELVQKIVREVATVNSAWCWNLKDRFYQQVDLDWPDYSSEVREKIRVKKEQIVVVEEKKPSNRPPPPTNGQHQNRARPHRPTTNDKVNPISFTQKYGTIPKTINNDSEYKEGCNKFNQIYRDYSKIFEELNSNRQLFLDFDRRWKTRTSEEEKQKLKTQIQHEYNRRVTNVKQKRAQYRSLHQTLSTLKQELVQYANKQEKLQQNLVSVRTN